MEVAEFDRFADEYHSMHAANIAITGEQPEFFPNTRCGCFARRPRRWRAAQERIIDFGSGTGNSVGYFRKYYPDAALTCADVVRPQP